MIKLYREGELSLSTLASKLELSVSETIESLSQFGIESPLDYHDYLKGFERVKTLKLQEFKKEGNNL
ncbi:MAG: hypothetical protein AB1397_06710 [bacterium]